MWGVLFLTLAVGAPVGYVAYTLLWSDNDSLPHPDRDPEQWTDYRLTHAKQRYVAGAYSLAQLEHQVDLVLRDDRDLVIRDDGTLRPSMKENPVEDLAPCYCGHVYDEHEPEVGSRPCAVEGCDCDMFDENLDAE